MASFGFWLKHLASYLRKKSSWAFEQVLNQVWTFVCAFLKWVPWAGFESVLDFCMCDIRLVSLSLSSWCAAILTRLKCCVGCDLSWCRGGGVLVHGATCCLTYMHYPSLSTGPVSKVRNPKVEVLLVITSSILGVSSRVENRTLQNWIL